MKPIEINEAPHLIIDWMWWKVKPILIADVNRLFRLEFTDRITCLLFFSLIGWAVTLRCLSHSYVAFSHVPLTWKERVTEVCIRNDECFSGYSQIQTVNNTVKSVRVMKIYPWLYCSSLSSSLGLCEPRETFQPPDSQDLCDIQHTDTHKHSTEIECKHSLSLISNHLSRFRRDKEEVIHQSFTLKQEVWLEIFRSSKIILADPSMGWPQTEQILRLLTEFL